ncbi:MAG: DUF1636 family protein [Sedimentitalea sp.]
MTGNITELLVCTKCNMGQPVQDGVARAGTQLHDALTRSDLPEGIVLKPVECFSNCPRGCSIVLRGGADKWTFVYGNLSVDLVEILVDGASRYHSAADGLVPWRERPEHFRKNCISRIPPIGDL